MRRMSIFMNQEGAPGGGGAADWRTTLPEALRAEASLASFKDVGSLAQSYVETKKLVGASIRPPGPDASPEVRKEFIDKLQKAAPELIYAPEKADEPVLNALWKRLGKPEKPEEYALDEETAKSVNAEELRALAAKTGLTKGQFAELAKTMAAANTEASKKHREAHEALDKEWGAAKDDRLKAAAAVAHKLGMSEAAVKGILERTAPAEQLKFLHSVAQAVGTDPKELNRQRDGGAVAMTPGDARAALNEIMANRSHAYWNAGDLRHGDAVKRVLELQGYANPQAGKSMEGLRAGAAS
jgi:hypothetical protein